MRVLLFINWIGKGHSATAHMAAELVEGLVARGCEVEVVCRGESREHAVLACERRVVVHGMDSQPCQHLKNRHLSELMLLWAFCRWARKNLVKYDRVICMDSPWLAGLAAGILKKQSGAHTLAWVMDLAFEQVARRSKGRLAGVVAWLMTLLQAWQWGTLDRIVTLGNCMALVLEKSGVPGEKIRIEGTWAEDQWAYLIVDRDAAKVRFGLTARFTVMYSGYAAEWHDFESIGEAIVAMPDESAIEWVFVGSGPGIDYIRHLADSLPAGRIVLMQRVDREELPALLACADVHLVSLRADMLGTCVPSKLYPLMALGKPVIFVGPPSCQTAIDLTRCDAGLIASNGRELQEELQMLATCPDTVRSMGENARRGFRANHCASAAINRWYELLRFEI